MSGRGPFARPVAASRARPQPLTRTKDQDRPRGYDCLRRAAAEPSVPVHPRATFPTAQPEENPRARAGRAHVIDRSGGARVADPRPLDRHRHQRHHRSPGAADGKAGDGRLLPRSRPRRHPLLHLSARHRHGDAHARRLPADELGDRLRRLPRRPGLGHAAHHPVAGEDRPGACRRTGRGDGRPRSGRAAHGAAPAGRACPRDGLRGPDGERARVLPPARQL